MTDLIVKRRIKISQAEKNKYCVLSLICEILKKGYIVTNE